MNAREKLDAADAASTKIIDEFVKAEGALMGGIDYNGRGVLYDPSREIGRMLEARDALNRAIEIYRSVSWPTVKDYDELEEIESEEMRQRQLEEGWL
jgi:hypothetical protein